MIHMIREHVCGKLKVNARRSCSSGFVGFLFLLFFVVLVCRQRVFDIFVGNAFFVREFF